MENKEKEIVKYLVSKEDYVSSNDIGQATGVSSRTVRKYMSILKEELQENGALLDVYHGQGFRIVIHDPVTFRKYLEEDEENPFNTPETRKKYLLLRLLTSTDYIDSYDLAEEVFISPSLLRMHLKDISAVLEKYHLQLVNSRSSGYKVMGEEKDVRLCISQECRNTSVLDSYFQHADTEDYISGIQPIIERAMKKFNIAVSQESIKSIALHFLIAITRLKTGNTIDVDADVRSQIHVTPEFFVTGYIAKQLKELYGITFTEDEQVYMTMHITGKRRLYGHEHLQVEVSREALVFINKFLRNIYKSTKVDLFEDEELRIALMNHVVPFLTRVRNHFLIHQDDLNNIKKSYPYAYELALYGLDGLLPQEEMTSAEIAYFTLHIALALEKRETGNQEKLSAIVVCHEVESMYVLLSYRLKKELDDFFSGFYFITVEDYHQNYSLIHENYDVVLNTTEENLKSSKTVIQISSRVTDSDVQKIRMLCEKLRVTGILLDTIDKEMFTVVDHLDSKEEVLDVMIQNISKKYSLPENFKELVLQREEIDSTEFGKYIAIPHPVMTIQEYSFVSVLKLNTAVKWKEHYIQLVFLINLPDSRQTKWFMDTVSTFLNEGEAVQDLLKVQNYAEFIEVLEKY